MTVATDITDRKRAEQELAEKEAQLRIALDNMPGGMFMIDNNQKFVLYNDQYRKLFDFPEGLMAEG